MRPTFREETRAWRGLVAVAALDRGTGKLKLVGVASRPMGDVEIPIGHAL
jgi:hypothetical protein